MSDLQTPNRFKPIPTEPLSNVAHAETVVTRGSTVDWSNPQKVNGRTKFAVTCTCGRVRWLVKKDARYVEQHQSPCYHCAQKIKAKLGFEANVEKYGWKFAVRRCQQHQIAHPEPSEVVLGMILNNLGLEYVVQYWLETKSSGREKRVYLVDAMIVHRGQLVLAIEINGGCHILPRKQEAQKRKLALLKRRGIPALVIDSTDMLNAERYISEKLGLAVYA